MPGRAPTATERTTYIGRARAPRPPHPIPELRPPPPGPPTRRATSPRSTVHPRRRRDVSRLGAPSAELEWRAVRRSATIETRATTATTWVARAAGRRAADRRRRGIAGRSSPILPQQLRAERQFRRRDRGRHRQRTAALVHHPRRGEPRRGRRGLVERRRESGTRSMIELDERELGERRSSCTSCVRCAGRPDRGGRGGGAGDAGREQADADDDEVPSDAAEKAAAAEGNEQASGSRAARRGRRSRPR